MQKIRLCKVLVTTKDYIEFIILLKNNWFRNTMISELFSVSENSQFKFPARGCSDLKQLHSKTRMLWLTSSLSTFLPIFEFVRIGIVKYLTHCYSAHYNRIVSYKIRKMVKLTPDLINQSMQYINPVRDRELDLRG